MKTRPHFKFSICLALLGIAWMDNSLLQAQGSPPPPPVPPSGPLALGAPVTPPPPAPVPPPPGRPPGPIDRAPDRADAMQRIEGTVSQYLMNPDGEADGLLLTDGTQLRFPPHMSADLTRVIKPNDRISAEGARETTTAFHAYTLTNAASNATLVESRPSGPPAVPPVPQQREALRKPLQTEGKIKALLTAPRGETDGAVLDNGTVLHFQPETAGRFIRLLASGQSLSARGLGTENQWGRSLEVTEVDEGRQSPASEVNPPPAAPPVPAPAPPVPPANR